MANINHDWLVYDCERLSLIKHIEKTLNKVNKDYFKGKHGIITVTDNSDYVAIKGQGSRIADYDPHRLFDALESFNQDDCAKFNDLWDYIQSCEYIPGNQENDNELKTNEELTFSEKQQVALVDWLLSEPVQEHHLTAYVHELERENKQLKESIKSLAFSKEREYQECLKYITSETAHFNKWIKQLQEEYQVLEKKKSRIRTEQSRIRTEQRIQPSVG